ncbi:MAG: NAD-dependent deacylase [Nitrospinota bacterium]|nr:NAD-dependent deacylase [Nitrospinota bacterium]
MGDILNIPDKLFEKIVDAERAAVLTGAGVSAESGVPTFRGENGLWRNRRPEELASMEGFLDDPRLVWDWYDWRRSVISQIQPNPGHYALAEFDCVYDQFTLITQNVDGLHALAGARDPVELHGNIWHVRCLKEGTVRENREVPLSRIPPLCPDCNSMLRPNIVWFGEELDTDILKRAGLAAKESEVFFVVGTSSVVQPAASLAGLAQRNGAIVVEINLDRTPITESADLFLQGKSGEILPALLRMIVQARGYDDCG